MSNLKISQLPIGAISANTIFPIVTDGVTSKATIFDLGGFISDNFVSGSYILGWETERQLGNSITIGLGKGRLLLTSGSTMITGVGGVDFTNQTNPDSPFFTFEATVIVSDNTKRYISLNNNTGSTLADISEIYSDNQYQNALGPTWTGITGEYLYFPYFIPDANGDFSNAEGYATQANGQGSHAEGDTTQANGTNTHAQGFNTRADGFASHAEGRETIAYGLQAHAEGESTVASGQSSHAEGIGTTAGGYYSHAEGDNTIAYGDSSHAEGTLTMANGFYSHAEGYNTITIGTASHAGGYTTIANGIYSFVHGLNSQVDGANSIVLGANITGSFDNTTFVDNLNIKTLPSGITLYSLGVDSFGNVIQDNSSILSSTTLNINGNAYDLSQNREWRVAQGDTGILAFGPMSALTNTTIQIGPNTGYIVDNETNPAVPSFTYINYSGTSSIAVPTSGTSSYVMLDSNGISFQNLFPTSAERKTKILLGKVATPNGIITAVINQPDFITSPHASFRDLFRAITYVNDSVFPYPDGPNLMFNVTGGKIYGDGINLHNSRMTPNELPIPPETNVLFLYRTQTGGTISGTTFIQPTKYDIGGVVTTVPGTASTIQYIFLVLGEGYAVQYGQTLYPTLNEAISNLDKESFTFFVNLVGNSVLIGVVAMMSTATDLSNTLQARFFRADKFGQLIGSQAGVSTSTLQNVYNNSVQAQITTTFAGGALQIKGHDLSTTPLIQGLNTSGNVRFNVSEGGDITSNSISAATYLGLPVEYNALNKTVWNNGAGNISTNTSFGDNALAVNTTGVENTAFGNDALALMKTGFFNVAVGTGALNNDQFGRDNTAVGDNALISNIGSSASTLLGSQSTAVGSSAMANNTTGNGTAVGAYSLYSQTTGLWNIVLGFQAGSAISTGSNNVVIASTGFASPNGITTGSNNMILAPNNGNAPGITTGSGNIVVGKVTGLAASATNTVTLADGVGNIRMSIDSTGATKFNGLISATTYLNLPTTTTVTGGTLSSSTNTITFRNNTGGTFAVTGVVIQDVFVDSVGNIPHGLNTELYRGSNINLTGGSVQFVTSRDVFGGIMGHVVGAGGPTTTTAYFQLFGNDFNGGVPNVIVGSTFSGNTITPALSFVAVKDDNYLKLTAATQSLFKFHNGYIDHDLVLDIRYNDFIYPKYPTSRVDTGITTNYLATDNTGRLISKPLNSITGFSTNLQSAYDNSPTPQIITNTSTNQLIIKAGVPGAAVLQTMNSAGLIGVTINGGGAMTAGSIVCNSITASTIASTTYIGLPLDIRVTGGTHNNGVSTFTNNTGGTFNVFGYSNHITGGTVSGATRFTNGFTANTIVISGGTQAQYLKADGSLNGLKTVGGTSLEGTGDVPVQIIISSTTAISASTTDVDGNTQHGKNVIIANSASAITYTIDVPITTSFMKFGTGSITFLSGSGRTLIQVDATNVLNGIIGSTASIISVGTQDFLRISNA